MKKFVTLALVALSMAFTAQDSNAAVTDSKTVTPVVVSVETATTTVDATNSATQKRRIKITYYYDKYTGKLLYIVYN